MQATRRTSPYEVICPRCDVTFPTGTRHCIHCGGPIGRGRRLFAAAAAENVENAPPSEAPPGIHEAAEQEEEEELARRSSFSPISILWLVLIAGGAIFRACAEG